jgi:hypothetical protein
MRLSPTDALILTQVIQFDNVPVRMRRKLLEKASPDGQAIGRYYLNPKIKISAARKKAADEIRGWLTA